MFNGRGYIRNILLFDGYSNNGNRVRNTFAFTNDTAVLELPTGSDTLVIFDTTRPDLVIETDGTEGATFSLVQGIMYGSWYVFGAAGQSVGGVIFRSLGGKYVYNPDGLKEPTYAYDECSGSTKSSAMTFTELPTVDSSVELTFVDGHDDGHVYRLKAVKKHYVRRVAPPIQVDALTQGLVPNGYRIAGLYRSNFDDTFCIIGSVICDTKFPTARPGREQISVTYIVGADAGGIQEEIGIPSFFSVSKTPRLFPFDDTHMWYDVEVEGGEMTYNEAASFMNRHISLKFKYSEMPYTINFSINGAQQATYKLYLKDFRFSTITGVRYIEYLLDGTNPGNVIRVYIGNNRYGISNASSQVKKARTVLLMNGEPHYGSKHVPGFAKSMILKPIKNTSEEGQPAKYIYVKKDQDDNEYLLSKIAYGDKEAIEDEDISVSSGSAITPYTMGLSSSSGMMDVALITPSWL